MSLSGLRKQLNKANQYLSETVGAAEPTKLDDEYSEMERKIDLTYELISALIAGTHEYLQPNPATRAKMAAMGAMSKVRGTTKSQAYPQTEGLLADSMLKYGKALGEDSDLGKSLCDAADAYRQMADIKYQLEDVVKHNFLDPITHLQANELKDVIHHRTKLKGRRLDYDCKKRKQTRDEELIQAEEKLEESKRLAEQAMFNVLSNDVEQISQLKALVESQMDFHQQTLHVLDGLKSQLTSRIKEASERQRIEHIPKSVLFDRSPRSRSPSRELTNSTANMNMSDSSSVASASYAKNMNGSANSEVWSPGQQSANKSGASPIPPTPESAKKVKAQCKAIYDFEAQNPGELEFKEGQVIDLISQIDENWYEGTVNGKSGFFPISYVQVTVPLP
ncbi:BAR domain-containing protein [Ditylenchus destructor]|uniref:BAR domain-containing protein n=1 Tax=Ditylenchus destructor TaxID=166010 RepID=A0AAD4RDM7_9BILA|nr:BAR domain-containing protein [Ditylenchus destructor]